MSSSQETECSICEKGFGDATDLVCTSCGHTFHRKCAEKRVRVNNKPDCRVCGKSSALADALISSQPTTDKECAICENSYGAEDDLVTTSCSHTFHRTCAETRIEQRNKSDCRVCEKPGALKDALRYDCVVKNKCSICKVAFDLKPNLVTTSCRHIFHRSCAEDRVQVKKKSDCRACQKPSALADALNSKQPISDEECAICEKPCYLDDDLVTTRCSHTYHRACVEKRIKEKNRSDCRVCEKPAALTNALLPNQFTIEGECKICEELLDTSIKTSCGHKFHRACANKCVNEEKLVDCHVCHKDDALRDALNGGTKTSTPTEPQQNVSNVEEYAASKSVVTGASKPVERKDYWKCEECSIANEPSSTRCGSCGKTRYAHPKSSDVTLSQNSSRTNSERSDKTRVQQSDLQPKILVYIKDLPSLDKSDEELTSIIRQRIETMSLLQLVHIECYSKLGIGFIHVKDHDAKRYLIKNVIRLAVSPQDASATILFTETLEYVSYVVLSTIDAKDDIDWPQAEQISCRWVGAYSEERPQSCEQVDAQFPNIYRVVSSSFDQLREIMENPDFGIGQNLSARVYLGADCSYLENLERSITDDQLRQAITTALGQMNVISRLDLHIQLNKQTNNACVLAANMARKLATKTIYLGKQPITTTENLAQCLAIYSEPGVYSDDTFITQKMFNGKARKVKRRGKILIVEISDRKVFNECMKRKILRIDEHSFPLDIYIPFNDPEECEIDADTWYKSEMLRHKADIMQFVSNGEHKIFRFKWNTEIWLKEFRRANDRNSENQGNITNLEMRHRLRVTVMLNTIAAIRNKSYMIGDREIKLTLDSKMKTIVYNHQSKIRQGGPLPLKKTPYGRTKVLVVNKDCLVVYEDLVKQGKKPLLLNMANATSPGGGYRKGDGAQEENLFRRSDYLRSLDIGLDEYIEGSSERLHHTSTCDLDSTFDSQGMYPMDEYGGIYTSGLTVFRRTEEEGYAYMEKPLTGVCSLAMAAYRDPKLDGDMLSSKYAVGTRKKIENVFSIAYHHKHDCLVLSAFGCGAFKNPPEHVAKIFRSVIEQYAGFFDSIIFAIIDDHNTGKALNKQGNFQPFSDEFNGEEMKPCLPVDQPNTIFGPYRFLSDGSTVNDVNICDATPCSFGAKCNQMYDPKHAPDFAHPPACTQQLSTGKCTRTGDVVHMSSFIHREPCKHGAQCRDIDNKIHAEAFDHPTFCPGGGDCQDTKTIHEKEYRHLPLCKHAHKCVEFQKHLQPHCSSFRHYMPNCRDEQNCVEFHNKEHMSNYKHPFPTPCPWTPYNCPFGNESIQTTNSENVSQNAHRHCLEYAHVCQYGRNCADRNSWHWEKYIHVWRMPCKYGEKCHRKNQEDHLNSCTHAGIRDIRIACKHADKCHERQAPNHLSRYRHSMTFQDSGVVRFFNLNRGVDFVRNQNDNIKRVLDFYAKDKKWKSFTLETIPKEIIDWVRTVPPIHRCKPDIFESIILHGHVMSLEYMDNLRKPKCVANSVLQHSRMRRIGRLKSIPDCAEHARKYITASVTDIYEKAGFLKGYPDLATGAVATHADDATRLAERAELIKKEERILSAQIADADDMEAIRTKTKEIAEASMKLNLNKTGIGYGKDVQLGTNKTVFSIMGPHTGHYYGDVVLVFKREILHHPDANFSIQAATSYASGNCYKLRPWLGTDPGKEEEKIGLFHKTKLHPSIPGYDYAAALELIAVTSHILKKDPSEIDLDRIIERWFQVDSHEVIESHLPSLIPLDYIELIYMPRSTYKTLSEHTRKLVDDIFKDSIVYYEGEMKDYKQYIVTKLDERFRQASPYSVSRPTHGAILTIPATNFNDHYVLPLTISQADEQNCRDHGKVSKDSTIYIYWQLMNGDMMLTLSSKPFDAEESSEKNSCLICYLAPKPTFAGLNNIDYHEQTSYLNSGQPFEHSVFINERKFAGKSNEFYIGCNTDDVMTLCLEIERATGRATLSHAGPNSIYNQKKISCTFSSSQLDLKKLEFIHVSAGSRIVPVRNLIVTYQRRDDLHPTVDTGREKKTPSTIPSAIGSASSITTDSVQSSDEPGILTRSMQKVGQIAGAIFGRNDSSSLKPCSDSIHCLIQFSPNALQHNSQYTHPCRFGEFCRNQEPNLTHPSAFDEHPRCLNDQACDQIYDPKHRAQYSHTGLPFFLIPCRRQKRCVDESKEHRKKYSHGEDCSKFIMDSISTAGSVPSTSQKQTEKKKDDDDSVSLTPCKWGSGCREMADAKHCKRFSHPTGARKKDNRIACQWGKQCHDHKPEHRAKYSHPSSS